MRKRFSSKTNIRKTFIDNSGYRRFKESGKPVHRYAAENKLGRKLRPSEVVHHKNRNKLDNSPGNLAVFSNQNQHWRVHKQDAMNHGWSYSLNGKNKNR
ncbi:MAG: HNH endonuclease [Tissierellales bacterium]|nr:HNH endonuclease [Tissierellales bacterium]